MVEEVCPQALLPALPGPEAASLSRERLPRPWPPLGYQPWPPLRVSAPPQAQSRGSGCNNPCIHSLCPNRRPLTPSFHFSQASFQAFILMDLQSKAELRRMNENYSVERQSALIKFSSNRMQRQSQIGRVHGPMSRPCAPASARTHLKI